LKEEKQAQINSQETNVSGKVLKVKVNLSPIYRDVLLVRNSNASQANVLISNGKYIKLEPA
jgi:hypothetical protein